MGLPKIIIVKAGTGSLLLNLSQYRGTIGLFKIRRIANAEIAEITRI